MKFQIKTQDLKEVLELAIKVAQRTSTIPVLSTVLLELFPEQLRVSATDLDLFIQKQIPCESSEKSGAVCVSAHELFKICKYAECESLEFEEEISQINYMTTLHKVIVTGGIKKWHLEAFGRDQFPQVPTWSLGGLKMDWKSFRAGLARISFAITQEQSRFTLNAAKIMIKDSNLKMVATDGHRLAVTDMPCAKIDKPIEELLPSGTIKLLLNPKLKDEQVSIQMFNPHWFIKIGEFYIISRVLSGQFPDYTKIFPNKTNHEVEFHLQSLKRSLLRLSAVEARQSYRHYTWVFNRSGISAIRNENCSTEMSVNGFDANEISLGFNPVYISEMLKVFPKGRCEMRFNDKHGVVVFEPETEGFTFQYAVMPLRS